MANGDDEPSHEVQVEVREWVIAVCVAALSLLAGWTVFGDDLVQLFQPGPAVPAAASTATESRLN